MTQDFKVSNEDSIVAVPGVVDIVPLASGRAVLRVGPAAGWVVGAGVQRWERELSFIARADLSPALARSLRATLPVEQIAPRRYPWATRAVDVTPLVGIAANLSADLRKEGVRVHTVGFDRISAGFFYFAEGGKLEPIQVQGSLLDMLAPSLGASTTNAEIAFLLEPFIDRLLALLSHGLLSEAQLELADALPRMSRDGTGLMGTDLDLFERRAAERSDRSRPWAEEASRLVASLASAERAGQEVAEIPLYREARRETLPPLELVVGGKTLALAAKHRWTVVAGPPREELPTGRLGAVESEASAASPAPKPARAVEATATALASASPADDRAVAPASAGHTASAASAEATLAVEGPSASARVSDKSVSPAGHTLEQRPSDAEREPDVRPQDAPIAEPTKPNPAGIVWASGPAPWPSMATPPVAIQPMPIIALVAAPEPAPAERADQQAAIEAAVEIAGARPGSPVPAAADASGHRTGEGATPADLASTAGASTRAIPDDAQAVAQGDAQATSPAHPSVISPGEEPMAPSDVSTTAIQPVVAPGPPAPKTSAVRRTGAWPSELLRGAATFGATHRGPVGVALLALLVSLLLTLWRWVHLYHVQLQ
jgi:hypothetical protein